MLERPPSPMSLASGTSHEAVFNLTAADLAPTFRPKAATTFTGTRRA